MCDHSLFRLPPPLPEGAVLLGPAAWSADAAGGRDDVRRFDTAAAALAWLRGERGAAAGASRLIVVHQDAFAGADGADRLVRWLDDVRALRGPLLPVLLHGSLGAEPLVSFFRAGLFDALPAPVERAAWINLLIRAEKRLEHRQQSRLILASSGLTRDTLRRLRRELGEAAEVPPVGLLRAQESLQAANRQLTDAMAELSLLYRFGRELSTARNWDRVLRDLLRSLAGFVGAGGAALILRSAAEGRFSPRQTWQWDESAWDKVLVNLNDQVDAAVAESIVAPGVFRIDPSQAPAPGAGRRIIALPLEHQQARLGYLLLLFGAPDEREAVSRRYLPFLQAVQMVLSEEVAGAQMLDRIREIGAFNARVLETVRSAIWVIADDGRTVYCNRAGQELLTGEPAVPEPEPALFEIGRGRDGAPGQPALPELFLDARLRLDDVPGVQLAALRARPDGAYRGEGRIVRADRTAVPVLVQTSLMAGRQRDETWLVVVAEDLRESRKLEAERLRAERLEGLVEMSATLAHEIRNPLAGLSAQAELLAEQLSADDRRVRYLDVITREVERIDDTITRMLNFVRPYEPDLGDCALPELAADVLELARPRAAAKGVALGAPQASGDLGLRADGGQLKQVLLNLLFNAVDAAPEGGRVTLRLAAEEGVELPDRERGTRRVGAGVVLEVCDDGPGVAPPDLGRIFRPFYTTKSSGTGLGLSLCHKIVSAHGGDMGVERRGDQTVFRVVLPRTGGALPLKQMEEEAS